MEAHFEMRISYLDEALVYRCSICKTSKKIQRALLRERLPPLGKVLFGITRLFS